MFLFAGHINTLSREIKILEKQLKEHHENKKQPMWVLRASYTDGSIREWATVFHNRLYKIKKWFEEPDLPYFISELENGDTATIKRMDICDMALHKTSHYLTCIDEGMEDRTETILADLAVRNQRGN